jgi:hypothetical protein
VQKIGGGDLLEQIGKCLCGAVEFKILGQVPNFYQCYCSLCQKQTGSSHNTATLVNEHQFNWTKGQVGIVTFTKNTGFSSHNCRQCNCPVPNLLRGTGKYWIPVGLLEGSKHTSKKNPKVVLHLNLDSKAPWQSMPEQGHQFGTMPDFTTIFNLLEP